MMKEIVSATVLFLLSSVANAAAECTEQVSRLIMHTDGSVYFTTSQTCSSWCKLVLQPGAADGGQAANSKGYAMLLTAVSADKPVRFYWPNISGCTTVNAQYASPGYFYITP